MAADTITLEVDDLGLDFGGLPEGLGKKCDALKTTGSIRIQINAINDKPHVAVPGSVYRGLPGGTDRASLRRDLELIRVKPLTVDEKVSALASLSKKPKAGQVVYWPNVDGVNIPMDPFGFGESVRHNWL